MMKPVTDTSLASSRLKRGERCGNEHSEVLHRGVVVLILSITDPELNIILLDTGKAYCLTKIFGSRYWLAFVECQYANIGSSGKWLFTAVSIRSRGIQTRR